MSEIKPRSKANLGRLIIFGLLLTLAGIVVFRYLTTRTGGVFGPPAEYTVRYMPADYEMSINIDEEDALAILRNPQRYRREFNQLVYDINTDILRHVARRMGLNDSLQQAIILEYDKRHPAIRSLYYNDFIEMQDTTAGIYETWYDNEGTSATDILREVASKYTCFMVNEIVATVIKTTGDGSFFARGDNLDTPCGIALQEALNPMVQRLADRAAIEDFSRSRGLLQEKVERVIGELATMEVRDKKGINKQLQTKIWGFNVSQSDLEITAISILKVGFRLTDYFDVELNANTNIVTVTLPEPIILSHEVYPKIEKLDIGWLREVENVNFNESFNALRKEFRREANESDIKARARTQAIELMNTMFGPLLAGMNRNYQLKVAFQASTPDRDIPEWEEEPTALDQR